VHKDYADFSEFHQKFRRELGPHFESFKTFLVSLRGNEIWRLFTFNDLAERATPNFSVIDSQRRTWKRLISPNLLKAGPVLNIREGDSIIATYTSAADKMKVFSAFIREGLENDDAVFYIYPDEESETVRTELKKNGVDVEEYEKDETLHLESSGEFYMPNGKLDFKKAVIQGLNWWNDTKKRRNKHARAIGDVGDFSTFNGQWQKYVTDYWLDPRWNDPNVSEWVKSKEPRGAGMIPFIMEITAINVEHMSETQIHEILKAFGGGESPPTRFGEC